MIDMTVVLVFVFVLFVAGELIAWVAARRLHALVLSTAHLVAVKLAASEQHVSTMLSEIQAMTNGRLDLALDKVTRLETALARERGEEPPKPNPLAMHADQPTVE